MPSLPIGLERAAAGEARGDAGDGVAVAGQVALGVVLGAGALAQHVVAEGELRQLLAGRSGLALGLVDVAAQHELAAQQLDGAHRGGHCTRLAAMRPSKPPLSSPGRNFFEG
ncbi:MAG: hypothetical protein U1E77_17515 [Inhella sp.]